MWVSTGKAGTPKACDITTLAVLCPTPGKASKSSKDSGTWPLCLSRIIWLKSKMALLLNGDNPQGFIISRISSMVNFTISEGLLAFANKEGVIKFTRLSVHWALNKTAINKVYASV